MTKDVELWYLELETTPWFDYSVKPTRLGIYQIECPHQGLDIAYSDWDGSTWGCFAYSLEVAYLLKDTPSYSTGFRWRGLVGDPLNTVNK